MGAPYDATRRGGTTLSGMTISAQGYGPDHESPFGYGLHHVQLAIPAGSEDECRAFYVEVLGMVEIAKPAVLAARGGLWVRADTLEIHLGVEEGFRAARKAHPGIRVTGLDVLADRLTDRGVDVTWDGNFPGHRRFYASDNAGNRLEFIERAAPA
jgi:catechol 2,3-dioxygenase-like lactoylglutathione lyase family enzyme